MPPKEFKIVNGKIRLNREHSQHTTAFSIVHASLNELENRLDTLHQTEQAVSDQHKFEAKKKAYLLGRFASRSALSLLLPKGKLSTVFIGNGVFSFPIIEGDSCGLEVCITHCDGIGMALVYPQAHPLGIDLEKVDPKRIQLMEEQLTANEQLLTQQTSLSKVASYTMAWTIKESLSKVLRTGMTLNFKLIELEHIIRKGNYYESTFVNFGQYKAISYHFSDYVCTIVLPKFTTPDLGEFEKVIKDV